MPWAGLIPRLVFRVEKRKLSGNCAPLEKNLEQYLKDNPNCEVVTKRHPLLSIRLEIHLVLHLVRGEGSRQSRIRTDSDEYHPFFTLSFTLCWASPPAATGERQGEESPKEISCQRASSKRRRLWKCESRSSLLIIQTNHRAVAVFSLQS